MSVKPIWRKKPNLCNTSNELKVNSPTPMPKPLTSHHEPSHENNHPNRALPNPYIKDTHTTSQVISHPSLPISPNNSHVTHTQVPLQEALRGNTRDLDSIGEETRQDFNFTPSGFKDAHTVPRDGVVIPSDAFRTYKRRRQELCDGVRT
nr:hypothetical protein [Tanacetum cinerariifolium]